MDKLTNPEVIAVYEQTENSIASIERMIAEVDAQKARLKERLEVEKFKLQHAKVELLKRGFSV